MTNLVHYIRMGKNKYSSLDEFQSPSNTPFDHFISTNKSEINIQILLYIVR